MLRCVVLCSHLEGMPLTCFPEIPQHNVIFTSQDAEINLDLTKLYCGSLHRRQWVMSFRPVITVNVRFHSSTPDNRTSESLSTFCFIFLIKKVDLVDRPDHKKKLKSLSEQNYKIVLFSRVHTRDSNFFIQSKHTYNASRLCVANAKRANKQH